MPKSTPKESDKVFQNCWRYKFYLNPFHTNLQLHFNPLTSGYYWTVHTYLNKPVVSAT